MVDSLHLQGGISQPRQESKTGRDSVRPLNPATPAKEVPAQGTSGQVAPPEGKASPAVEPDQGARQELGAALEQALNTLSEHVQNLNRTLQFSVDRDSGRTIIKVIDSETNEVIRQIPQEEMLVIANRLQAASGVLLVEQA